MAKKAANLVVDVLVEAGIERVYGGAGNSLNGITDIIRAGGRLQRVHMRYEEAGAFAAGAEAHLTGKLAVCVEICGTGDMHLMCPFFLLTTMRELSPDGPRYPSSANLSIAGSLLGRRESKNLKAILLTCGEHESMLAAWQR
jgi:hypothetical protein